MGLSTAVFIDLCTALFADDPAIFLFMLAIILFSRLPSRYPLPPRVPPSSTAADKEEDTKFFILFNNVVVVFTVYLLTFSVTDSHGRLLSRSFAIAPAFFIGGARAKDLESSATSHLDGRLALHPAGSKKLCPRVLPKRWSGW